MTSSNSSNNTSCSSKQWLKILVKKVEDEILHQGDLMDPYKELKCVQELFDAL